MGATLLHCVRIDSSESGREVDGEFEAVGGSDGYRDVHIASYGPWPEARSHAGLALRSVSKMIIAAAFMALAELGPAGMQARGHVGGNGGVLSLGSKVGDFIPECRGGTLESATAKQLLTMSAGFDDRLNIAWERSQESKVDHVGFPSFCDVKGFTSLECAVHVVCPAYSFEGPGRGPFDFKSRWDGYALPPELSIPHTRDVSCEDHNRNCQKWAKSGECSKNQRYMLNYCPISCGLCQCPRKTPARGGEGGGIGQSSSSTSTSSEEAGVCGEEGEEEEEEEEDRDPRYRMLSYVRDEPNHGRGMFRRRKLGCTYDNYSYSLLDAMVEASTGRQLWQWTLDLVARPLGMQDMLRCMATGAGAGAAAPGAAATAVGVAPHASAEEDDGSGGGGGGGEGEGSAGVADCYVPPKLDDLLVPDAWPLWRGGPESVSWPGTSLFGSSRDLVKFLAMLGNNGTLGGVRILSEESVEEMLTPISRGSCQGMEKMGLGIGTCMGEEGSYKNSNCKTTGWWGWGGSYGMRAMLVKDVGLACITMANLPSEETTRANGKKHRLAGAQHPFAHEQARRVREIWPEGWDRTRA